MHWRHLYVLLIFTMFINDFLSEDCILDTILCVTTGWTPPSPVKLPQSFTGSEEPSKLQVCQGQDHESLHKTLNILRFKGSAGRQCISHFSASCWQFVHGYVNVRCRKPQHHQDFPWGMDGRREDVVLGVVRSRVLWLSPPFQVNLSATLLPIPCLMQLSKRTGDGLSWEELVHVSLSSNEPVQHLVLGTPG